MNVVREMPYAGPGPANWYATLPSLSADERAELVWGDEGNSVTAVNPAHVEMEQGRLQRLPDHQPHAASANECLWARS